MRSTTESRIAPSVSTCVRTICPASSWVESFGGASRREGSTAITPCQPEKRATFISLASSGASAGPATRRATFECALLPSCGFADATIPTSPGPPSSPMMTLR